MRLKALPKLGVWCTSRNLGFIGNSISKSPLAMRISPPVFCINRTLDRSSLHLTNGMFVRKPCVQFPKVIARQLHTEKPLRRPDFNSPFGNRPQNFRLIDINPVVKILAVIGLISVTFFVLPFLFVVLFPLIIGFVAFSQFRAFRRKKILGMLDVALRNTSMKLSNRTLKELVGLYFRPHFEQAEAMSIFNNLGRMYSQMDIKPPNPADFFNKGDFSHACRFLSFVEARVLESLEKDENGIRTQLFGPDYLLNHDDIQFNSDTLKAFGRMFNNDVFSGFSFTMLVRGRNGEVKPAAIVSIASKGSIFDGSSDLYNLHFSNSDVKHPMVIYVTLINTLSFKPFFITEIGETGRRGHYTVRKDSKGKREFTYHD